MVIKKDQRKVSPLSGEERYLLPVSVDYKILDKIHQVEKIPNLTENEKFLILFTRSQLEKDWRRPLITILDELLKNKELSSKERWKKVTQKVLSNFWSPSKGK